VRSRPLVLGLRPLGLGDLCCSVPAWKALRRGLDGHRTVLAAPAWQQELLALIPAIDDLVPTGELAPLSSAVHHADLALNLHGPGPDSTQILADTAPRRLVTFEPADATAPTDLRWDPDEHEVHRWCRLVASLGLPADPEDLGLLRPAIDAPCAQATVVHVGADAPARRWPVERWTRIVSALERRGHRVVLTGVAGERDLTAAVAERAALDVRADLAGRTTAMELAALVADARLVVSGDTGIAHLATAFVTPSVVLFGPTPPFTWGPPGSGPHVALWAGRLGDPHGQTIDPGLLAITVDDVLAAVDQLDGR
jgi:ADP-heptose:LPS heptosyltransferase